MSTPSRLVLLLLPLVISCGGGSSPAMPEPDAGSEAAATSNDPNRISSEQLAAARVATAYEAVDRLKRSWFKDGLTGRAATIYWDDNQPLGGIDELRQIPIQDVVEIRYLDGRASNQRWPGNTGGAIVVVKRRR
jgi:hypothetical protein